MKDNKPSKDKNAGFKPTPVRLPVELDTAITEAADQLRMSKQDVIRLTIDIGLKHLKANNYDIAAQVVSVTTLKTAVEALHHFLVEQKKR